jgi:predicted PurR-regulated permease PerM
MKEKVKENRYYQIGMTAFIVIACSIVFYFLLFKLKDIVNILGGFIAILTPFIVGFVFAYLLNPVVKFFYKKVFLKIFKKSDINGKYKLCNVLSILVTCLLFVGLLVLLFSFIIPEVLKSIELIAVNAPTYVTEIKNWLLKKLSHNDGLEKIILNNYDSINQYINTSINKNLLPKVDQGLSALSDGLLGAVKVAFNIAMGFVISIYYLSDKDNFKAGIKKITYAIFPIKTANNIMDSARHTNNIFGSFIVGKLLDGLTIGFITFVFLTIFGYKYALLIGVTVGLTNMIPYFGPYIGTIPSALIILMESPTKCLIFILFIIALQQLDSYLIEPKLCGSKTGLKSFWVLASILFFGNLFGIIGLLLGVPVFALLYGYLNNKCLNKLKEKNLPTDNSDYENLERINTQTNKVVSKN